jgi:calcineurin-like phosphoesterase family protein
MKMNKVYAVADLHGMYALWRSVIELLDETDTLYVLGDCADRGPDGWAIIKEALADPRVIYVRGNHDQFLLDSWRSDWYDNWLWFNNGGYLTYESVVQDEKSEIYLMELSKTKLYHCYENKNGKKIHLTHAGFTLMENDELPNSHDMLWDREHIGDECRWWKAENPSEYVVHGHTGCCSSVFKRRSGDTQINATKTVCRYVGGHKICIDGRSFVYNQCALLDLDTLQEIVVKVIKNDYC